TNRPCPEYTTTYENSAEGYLHTKNPTNKVAEPPGAAGGSSYWGESPTFRIEPPFYMVPIGNPWRLETRREPISL
ncbi:MAG: hypothetical protein ACPLQP_09320, partial [Moorellaceae bacterium]